MADSGEWDVEFYADEQGREPCREWADDLSPQKRAAFIEAVRLVLARRVPGVVESEYGKALGGGLYELRVRWSAAEIRHKVQGLPPDDVGKAPEKIMLRVFFCTSGRKIILLMSGYDKARDASDRRQEREIAKGPQAPQGSPGGGEARQQTASGREQALTADTLKRIL